MDLNPSQGLSNASAPTPDHNSFFTDSRASHPVSSSSKFPFTNPDMSTLVPSIGNFSSGNMIAPSRPTSGKATGLPTQPELEWDNNPAQLELASSARSKPEPKLASPSVSTRPQKPKVTTPASSSGGVSFGSRTRKLNRVGKMLLHGSSSLPGEEFNLAFLDLPEPCTVVSCHEGLCGRNLDDSFKQYELIGFKKSVIEWIRANENDLTNGGVCFLLHMENTFLCEDKEDLEYLNRLRKDRGFNRDYGTPDFEHCDFDTIECKKDTHENCICSKLFQNRGHCATCYKNWLERIVIVSTFHPLARAQTRRLQKVARKNLRGNVFARQLQYTSPRTIFGQADLTPLNVIGPNLEYIRKELGVVDVEDPWFAQADVDDTPDPGTWMSYFGLDGLSDSLKESYDVCVKAVKDMFKKCIDSIVGSLSWLKKLLTDLYDRVASLIIDSFFKPIKDYFSQIGKASLIAFVTLVLILILVTMGLFTWEKISQFLGYVVDSTASISVQVCSILSTIFKVELNDLLRYCKNMVLLTAGFSVTVTAGAKIFSMLPYGIRATMIAKFGTQSAKTNLLIDEWKARALTVLAMTRVPRVVSSDFYTEKLNEVQLEGFKFIKDLEPNRRMDILNIYNRINQAWSNVLAKVEAERSRCIPFSIHLAGPPGVGKTTLTKKLLYTLGYNETDTYHRPPCTEYWDGFVSAKVVIYDEFLINTETATTTATEYLNLVSSAPFRPPLASTDNISVGIKGIAANPEMVLTMNNSTHSVPSSLTSHAAFLRRRNMVLELDYDPDFCRAHNIPTSGNVPMKLVTGKERSDMAWVRTRFHDSKTNQQKSGWMTLARALELIKVGFDEHRKWFGVVQDERPDLGPCEYFEEILKLHYGVPTQTFNAWDFIKTTFSGIFSSNSEQTELKEVFTANGEVFRAQGKKGTKKRVKTALKEEGYHVMWVNKNGRSAVTRLNCTMNKDFGTYLYSILSGSGYDPKFGFQCNGKWYMMPESTKEIADFRLQPEYEMKELFANHPHAHTMKVVNFEHLPDAKPTGIDLSEPSLEPEPKDEPESPGHDEVDIPELPTVPPPESEPETPDDDETDSSSSIADADYQSSPEEPDQFAQDIEDRLAALMVPGEELDFATQMGILDHLTKAASSVYRWAKECGLWFLRAILPEDNFICWMVFFIMLWFIFIGYLVWKGNEAVIDLMESEATFYRTMKMEGQSDTSKKETSNKRTRKIQKASKKDWESQGQASMLGSITVVSGNSSSSQHCVSIGSRYILTTAHLWDYPTEVMKVTVSLNNQVYNFDLTSEQIALDVQNDIGLFRVPSIEFPNSKSMDNKFAFFNEICNIGTIQVTIQKAKENVYATSRLLPGWTYSSMSTTHQPERMFVYNARFENGDCGSIIRSADTIAAGKILAIHCCGNTSLSNPKGGATVVCFEDLQALKKELEGDVQLEAFEAVANGNVCEIEPWDEEDSNILDIRPLPRNDAVFFPTRTKISTSLLYGRVDHDSVKQPSVMKDNDPRTCRQPSENFIERLKILNNSKIDYDLLDSIKSTMVKNWKRDVNDLYRVRELTIEEAIGGIPNYLSSLKVKTSPGYPVCKMMDAKGKRACFEFNDSILKIEPWFKQAVRNRLLQMKAGECPDNRFIVFFKDELVSPSKVEEARTRAIYCNDVISLVAFRIRYGMTLARINNSALTTPSAIGLNQYSTDMHSVFTYLTATGNKNFIAGDYKNFDLSYHRDFQRAAYDVFFALNPITTEEENHYLWQHEAEVPLLQFKDKLIRVGCMHTSGCFLTSVINCFVNEMYFRYIFSLAYPQKVFDKECRLKVLGDDHILTVSDRVDFKPFKIRELMSQIGQTYTSDQKNQELEDRYRLFTEITFLGAHPRLVRVNSSMLYVGAPKQEQLWQTIQWTRTKNADLDTVVESCIYLASLWDKNFFDLFLSTVQKAYFEIGRDFISIPSYQECQRIAANRNAASGEDWFRAQGRVGLTQIIDENVQQPSENSSVGLVFGNDGIQEQPGSLDLGTDSLVHREDIKWTVNDGKNTIIYEVPCPFGIMAKGQDENLQNMPFIRYLYTRCDVEVVIQIAGTPFHQGALIAVLTPLKALDKLIDNTFGYRYEVPVPAMPFYNHVILSPNCSTTATLKQPFIWFRDWLSTSAKENYCRLHIGVLSPLLTGTDGSSSISLSIFSRFPNLKVVIPRPLDRTNTARDLTHDGLDRPACPTDDGNPDHWTAQGNHVSTSNNYNISNVAGSVPVGTSNQTSATDSTDLKLQANPNISALPMDNPPMCSGAIPTYPVFPSRSKTVGITTAVSMSQHPEEMHRQPHQQSAESMDMSVEKYCNRPTILGSFQWTPTSSVSDVLMSIPLNSTLFWPAKYEPGTPHWMPSCCFPLNLAQFWRADFEFTFVCVMTDFHSGRLRATVAYGCDPYNTLHNSIYRNEIMDFTSGSEVSTVLVPYNAPTEFLQSVSYMGSDRNLELEMMQEMGSLQVTVANALQCPPSVAQTVEVLVFVTARNVQLREVKPYNVVRPGYKITYKRENFVAQGLVSTTVEKDKEKVEETTSTLAVVVDDFSSKDVPDPCRLSLNSKFEYTWNNFGEIFRRYVRVAIAEYRIGNNVSFCPVFPNLWREMFTVWAGHIQLRLLVSSSNGMPPEVGLNFMQGQGFSSSITTGSVNLRTSAAIYEEGNGEDWRYQPNFFDSNCYNPVEHLYPINSNSYYIDLRVPFNSMFNFLPFSGTSFYKLMPVPFSLTVTNCITLTVWMKASDDLRTFIARPVCNFDPIPAFANEGMGGFFR